MFPGVKVETSLESACADPEVDLIIVSGPNGTHFEHAKVGQTLSYLSLALLS